MVAFTQAQSAGDIIVVAVGWYDTSYKVNKVTDSAGNSYKLAAGPETVGQDLSESLYYALNIAASPANKILVTFSGAAQSVDLRAAEYAGVTAFDKSSTNSNSSGTTGDTGSAATPGTPPELLVVVGITSDKYIAGSTGFTVRTALPNDNGNILEDEVTSSAGPYDATATLSTSAEWVLQLAAFH